MQNTIEQLAGDYERDGVIRVRGLLSQEEVQDIKEQLARYTREVVPSLPAGDRTFEADGASVRNLWRLEQHDEYFAKLAQSAKIRDIVRELVHGEPVLLGVETFNKPAKTGSGVPWHQDNAYFCQSPPDVLTVWIAMDAATIENGAVYYVKGSQHEFHPHVPSGVAGNSMGLETAPSTPRDEQFCGTLEPGDALIHHCQTMHCSDPNRSDESRLGLLMVFRGEHTQPDSSLKENYKKGGAVV